MPQRKPTTLFLEPFSGIAGDMFLAALLDLQDPRWTLEDLRALARQLVPGEVELTSERAWRGSLSGVMLTVRTVESGARGIPHRGLKECHAIVERSPLSAEARRRASSVFRRIAEAEARVHGTTPEEIHFHEVGAVDALIDICGVAHALDRLGVQRVLSTPPSTGTGARGGEDGSPGTVRCAHGEMPVPAPGTAEILRGLPMVLGGGSGERLTPTGAALLAEYVAAFEPPRLFVAERIGYAAGHRDPPDGPPNILRIQLGRELAEASSARATAWLMECNLDDMSGEELGFLVQRLREAGALEVWTAAVQMKKDRPGVVLSALCRTEQREGLEAVLFEESTTLGVRWILCERTEARRETIGVALHGRLVRVQRRRTAGPLRALDLSPEFDDLAEIARASGKPLRELEREAIELALRALDAEAGR
jgi:pyridinium-3,5-bisthiocarboxylic acid mononucleotide nickel chelatase